jgi:hypothetical protein
MALLTSLPLLSGCFTTRYTVPAPSDVKVSSYPYDGLRNDTVTVAVRDIRTKPEESAAVVSTIRTVVTRSLEKSGIRVADNGGTAIDVSIRRFVATYSYDTRLWTGCVELGAYVTPNTWWTSKCDADNTWGLISADAVLRSALQASVTGLLCGINGLHPG